MKFNASIMIDSKVTSKVPKDGSAHSTTNSLGLEQYLERKQHLHHIQRKLLNLFFFMKQRSG